MKLDLAPHILKKILKETLLVAKGASEILLTYFHGETSLKNQSSNEDSPVTKADLAANVYILERLQSIFGNDQCAYLSEENDCGLEAFAQEWVWIIDPLDGTKDFLQKTNEFAVHIALTFQGHPVVAVVAIPAEQKFYCAAKGMGSYFENARGEVTYLQVSNKQALSDMTLVVSRNHRDERFQKLIEFLPLGQYSYMGSIGCKIATIAMQEADIYISLSGKTAPKDWDFAAPELVLTEAGGKFTYLDGSPITYNRGDVSQWGVLIASNGICHQQLLDKVKEEV